MPDCTAFTEAWLGTRPGCGHSATATGSGRSIGAVSDGSTVSPAPTVSTFSRRPIRIGFSSSANNPQPARGAASAAAPAVRAARRDRIMDLDCKMLVIRRS